MATIRQFSEESSKRIGRVVRRVEGGGPNRRSRRRLGNNEGGFWIKIVSSSVVDADQEWDYTVNILDKFFDTVGGTQPAKNKWEEIADAGYENTSVTGLYAIPTNAVVRAYWGQFEDIPTIYFEERNEPKCD